MDSFLVLTARCLRMFSFGGITLVLISYLSTLMDEAAVARLLLLATAGDLVISLPLTTRADGWGRRTTLGLGAMLKFSAGAALVTSTDPIIILIACVIGVITTSGGEIGPFLPIEQACLTECVSEQDKNAAGFASIFATYNFLGYLASAAGALWTGFLLTRFANNDPKAVFAQYCILSGCMCLCYMCLSSRVEVKPPAVKPVGSDDAEAGEDVPLKVVSTTRTSTTTETDTTSTATTTTTTTTTPVGPITSLLLRMSGLTTVASLKTVSLLCALFALDAFAGGLATQSIIVVWFERRFQYSADQLGSMIAAANIVAGLSTLVVGSLVARFGAINVMVFSHLPSNVLLLLIPFVPNGFAAVTLLLLRFSISQMDVPARQAFVAAAVAPEEKSASGGLTNVARSVGVLLAPLVWGPWLQQGVASPQFSLPFVVAGALKIVYDLAVYAAFHVMKK